MCLGFCHIKRWCKAFTRIEICLSVVQTILLAVLIGLFTFLILHFLACTSRKEQFDTWEPSSTIVPFMTPKRNISDPTKNVNTAPTAEDATKTPTGEDATKTPIDQDSIKTPKDEDSIKTSTYQPSTKTVTAQGSTLFIATDTNIATSKSNSTILPSNVKCTWEPSRKTEASTHYYYYNNATSSTSQSVDIASEQNPNRLPYYDDEVNPDGEDAPPIFKGYVAALVKLKPPAEVTFGCILTKVTPYWTLTAASCVESVEEVDSLDSFFIMESFGESEPGRSHALTDVQIHPLYQGTNRSYDLAALRSEDALVSNSKYLLQLPVLMDYFLVGVGERFFILGYGRYRTIESGAAGRRLRYVHTYTVSLSQCGDGADVWALRHLMRGTELIAGACGGGPCAAAAFCAGALYSRGIPCSYCSGTPLLRNGRLFGVMSDNRQCGIACEPTIYVNIAALRNWIDSIIV